MTLKDVFPGSTFAWLVFGLGALFVRWVWSEATRPRRRRSSNPWQAVTDDFEARHTRAKYIATLIGFIFLAIAFLLVYEDGRALARLFGRDGVLPSGPVIDNPKW